MFGTHDLMLFIASGLLLNITPGPDTMLILGRTASHGGRGGAMAALGIGAGCFVHIVAAAVGLSALLAASATAFSVLKWLGGAYLVWLGLTLIVGSTHAPPISAMPAAPVGNGSAPLSRIFFQGFATNALNPKVALFFLAFLPQFIDADAAHKPLAFLFLGCVFNFNAAWWNLLVAWSAARVARRMDSIVMRRWLNRAIGGAFIYLGVRLAGMTR